jgi:hypothetical protein
MTVLAFVALMTVPVWMIGKSNPGSVVLVALWGLFLGMTAPGAALAGALNDLGGAALTALGGVGA